MDSKFEYDLSHKIEKPNFSRLSTMAMEIWREAEEGTALYDKTKKLLDAIEEEKEKVKDIKDTLETVLRKL